MMVQNKHSTYDSRHSTEAGSVVDNLVHYYKAAADADVLLWHDDNFTLASDSQTVNTRLCNLLESGGWGPPEGMNVSSVLRVGPGKNKKNSKSTPFSLGYRNMIRFYSVTIWPTLYGLGYRFVMRIDDDSLFLSPVPYNLFDRMREKGAIYAHRQTSTECGSSEFRPFVTKALNLSRRYCGFSKSDQKSRLAAEEEIQGFYNNFFVSDISWWLSPTVQRLVLAFDKSGLIYTRRDNDLVFQSAAVKLLSPRTAIYKYVDWAYAHITVNDGKWCHGGASTGTLKLSDVDAIERRFVRWAHERYNVSVIPHRFHCAPEVLLTRSRTKFFMHYSPTCPTYDRHLYGSTRNPKASCIGNLAPRVGKSLARKSCPPEF